MERNFNVNIPFPVVHVYQRILHPHPVPAVYFS